MKTICMVTCYMGKLPDYFSFFHETCFLNPEINFLVINDCVTQSFTEKNLRIEKLSLDGFNKLASDKLSLPIEVKQGYKLCDFKPASGVIFEDYLKGFDFWGYCDLDLIFGNIRSAFTDEVLATYDVISSKDKWTSGHFSIFKNSGQTRKLFELHNDYKKVFTDASQNYFFEESGRRWHGITYSYEELKSQNLFVSMFDIVNHERQVNNLKVLFLKDAVREYPDSINYRFENGFFTDENNGKSFIYYHLLIVKGIWRFYIPRWKSLPEVFFVSPSGIYSKQQSKGLKRLIWKISRAFFCMKGILKSIGRQSAADIFSKGILEIKKSVS